MTKTRGSRQVGGAAILAASLLAATAAWAKPAPVVSIPSPVASAPSSVHQLGEPLDDSATQVAVDGAGNAYVVGQAFGVLPQAPAGESGPVFLAKYAPDGSLQWVRQFGTVDVDTGCGVVADSAGNVAVVGYARGDSTDQPWVARYDSAGDRQSSTALAATGGCALGAAALDRQGNLYYVSGVAADIPPGPGVDSSPYAALLVRVDPNDSVSWTRQLSGTNSVSGTAVAVDGRGNVYLAGYSDGVVDGAHDHLVAGEMDDGFVARYDADGVRHWVHEFGTADTDMLTESAAVAVDAAGNVAVTGRTAGTLVGSADSNIGEFNAFVLDYTAAGKVRWIRQFGAANGPFPGTYGKDGLAIASEPDGDIVFSGDTVNFPSGQHGQPDDADAFVAELDQGGAVVGYNEVASPTEDIADAVAVDRFGNVTVAGWTWGTLAGSSETNAGHGDAFVMHYQALSTAAIADAKTHARSGELDFAVTLDQSSPAPVAVGFHTVDGTAKAGTDYQGVSGTLVIPAGTTTASIPVAVTAGPSPAAKRLKLTMVLTNPSGVVLSRAAAIGTIIASRH